MSGLYVALGDSFTEGVGDLNPQLPNGVRGWADRVAKQLAKQDPDWHYANLAVRSKRLDQIVADQFEQALAMRPTLISFYAGGNDILEIRQDMSALMDRYEAAVQRLAETGARLLLFTGFDVLLPSVLGPMKRRNWLYNEAVRDIARRYGALLVDHWTFEVYQDPRLWGSDRLHMSPVGHRLMAAKVLDVLGVRHTLKPVALGPFQRGGWLERTRRDWEWLDEWVFPLFARKLRHIALGDALSPRWPEPVQVSYGLRKLAQERLLRQPASGG
ncbi:SGNH/GDSL hydrolase family protein [Arthrobacter sp. GCM10027362]|uniref:SGNH/GDSL hydrolase family protein n=1 Tax=Arthrobacter sp. GCM10027362 TaxID=3273379 RepID=UPI003639CEA5